MSLLQRLCYLAMAVAWAYCVHYFFSSAGQPAPHNQRATELYAALAQAPTVLLVAAALTSRLSRLGYGVRWVAILGTGTALALLAAAFIFGFAFFLIGGRLPDRVMVPAQWGSAALGVALVTLLLDVALRTRDLVSK